MKGYVKMSPVKFCCFFQDSYYWMFSIKLLSIIHISNQINAACHVTVMWHVIGQSCDTQLKGCRVPWMNAERLYGECRLCLIGYIVSNSRGDKWGDWRAWFIRNCGLYGSRGSNQKTTYQLVSARKVYL